jgi:hypothetical protein
MRLNWFSPLPPVSGAAADCSRRLLPLLHGRAEVTVWTEQSAWDRALERYAAVRRLDRDAVPWAEINEADASVYHLGAGAGPDAGAATLSGQHPGIVVLHGAAEPGTLDVALAVVVQDRGRFEDLRRADERPVVYAPPADVTGLADAVLRLAAEAGALSGALLARDLAQQAAAEVGVWMNAASASFWLRELAEEIRVVSVPPESVPAACDQPRRAA